MPSNAADSRVGATIRSLLVDLDGTLFNTLEANIAAYREAFDNSHVVFSEKSYRTNFGLGFNDLIKAIAPDLPLAAQEKIKQDKARLYPGFFSLVIPNHPLISFLEMQKKSCRIVLVSTASRENGEAILEHFEKKALFEMCFFREDVARSKPAPDVYLKAIDWLGTDASECLAFEDSDHGIQSARAAGVQVIPIL